MLPIAPPREGSPSKSRSVAGAGSAMEPLVISGDTSARRKVSYDSGGETDGVARLAAVGRV